MWWRLMAPFIACLTSHVLPKCVNPPPSPWKPSTFINALWRGLDLSEKIVFKQELSVLWSGTWTAETHINCPLPDSSRPLPSRYPPSRWADTHTDDDLTWLCATHVISLGGGCGSWGRLVLLVKVSRRSATPGPDGKCLVWGDGWLLNLASFWMFVQQTLTYCANNTWDSKIWRKGDYFELNCFILFSRQCNHV